MRFGYSQELGCTSITFERPGPRLAAGTERRQAVDGPSRALALFAGARPLTSRDVAEGLGTSLRQAQRILRGLEAEGLVDRAGQGRGTTWNAVRDR